MYLGEHAGAKAEEAVLEDHRTLLLSVKGRYVATTVQAGGRQAAAAWLAATCMGLAILYLFEAHNQSHSPTRAL